MNKFMNEQAEERKERDKKSIKSTISIQYYTAKKGA